MILIIDNYDSFTQNLAQCVGELGFEVKICRNDEISLSDVNFLRPTHVVLSPGPGQPTDTGISLELIQAYASKIPILGVCLGHQSIGYAYGAYIKQLHKPMHAKVSKVLHKNDDIFSQLSNPFNAVRYHSLIIDNIALPGDLEVTAWTQEGIIMGCRHKYHKLLRGIQFHPESLWTNEGKLIIKNFLST